jgi:hypothetical protein
MTNQLWKSILSPFSCPFRPCLNPLSASQILRGERESLIFLLLCVCVYYTMNKAELVDCTLSLQRGSTHILLFDTILASTHLPNGPNQCHFSLSLFTITTLVSSLFQSPTHFPLAYKHPLWYPSLSHIRLN